MTEDQLNKSQSQALQVLLDAAVRGEFEPTAHAAATLFTLIAGGSAVRSKYAREAAEAFGQWITRSDRTRALLAAAANAQEESDQNVAQERLVSLVENSVAVTRGVDVSVSLADLADRWDRMLVVDVAGSIQGGSEVTGNVTVNDAVDVTDSVEVELTTSAESEQELALYFDLSTMSEARMAEAIKCLETAYGGALEIVRTTYLPPTSGEGDSALRKMRKAS